MKLMYRNASLALPDLCQEVLTYGVDVPSRNGITKELTMLQVELTEPWPLVITAPGRKVSIAAQIAETMWVLSGRNDVEWLANYLPQAPKFSDDGKTWRGGYGPRLRAFRGQMDSNSCAPKVDQLKHVVKLLSDDPSTRRAVMSIYDPAVDTEPGKDIPCNNWLHFLPRDGKLSLHVAIRSNDLMWGWSGINSFEWGALLHIVAGLTGLEVGSLTFSISSLHLYQRHLNKAGVIAQGKGSAPRFIKENPTFQMPKGKSFDALVTEWFEIEQLIREGGVSQLATVGCRIDSFPEPMLRSWLQVLAGWWYDTRPGALHGTPLGYALAGAPKPKRAEDNQPPAPANPSPAFAAFVAESDALHRDKDKAYGSSWCRRGEQMAIMANIARKVDRLGVDGGGDTSLDTAQDLMIYLAKYQDWLLQSRPEKLDGTEHADRVRDMLIGLRGERYINLPVDALEEHIRKCFGGLEYLVRRDGDRAEQLERTLKWAAILAYRLWGRAQVTEVPAPVPAAETEAEFLGNTPRSVTDMDMWRAGNATRQFNGYADPENS